MTLQEASSRYHVDLKSLQFYEQGGLLQGRLTEDGVLDYREKELQRAFEFHCLVDAGMDLCAFRRFVALQRQGPATAPEQIQLLRRCRCQLLEEIHKMQQTLDQLDFFIHQIKGGQPPQAEQHPFSGS